MKEVVGDGEDSSQYLLHKSISSIKLDMDNLESPIRSKQDNLKVIIGEHKALIVDMFDKHLKKYRSLSEMQEI